MEGNRNHDTIPINSGMEYINYYIPSWINIYIGDDIMSNIIILAVIGLYVGYVVYKKYKDIKKGKFCNCECDSCPSESKCHKE